MQNLIKRLRAAADGLSAVDPQLYFKHVKAIREAVEVLSRPWPMEHQPDGSITPVQPEDMSRTPGAEGDFYLDKATDTLYGPKTAGKWSVADMSEWLASDEGKAAIADSQVRYNAAIAQLNAARAVDPQELNEPYTATAQQTKIDGFERGLAADDAYDVQSFIDGAKWAEDKLISMGWTPPNTDQPEDRGNRIPVDLMLDVKRFRFALEHGWPKYARPIHPKEEPGFWYYGENSFDCERFASPVAAIDNARALMKCKAAQHGAAS